MDFYLVLGIERGATLNDVKRAYRRLSRRYHPGVNPGDERARELFRQIVDAYQTLGDAERRQRYDTRGGDDAAPGEGAAFGFDGFDFSISVSGSAAPTFGDLFADVIQQRAQEAVDAASGRGRGADLHQTLTMGLEDALRGGRRELIVTRRAHCRGCGGAGRVAISETACGGCHGSGVLRSTRGHMVFSKACGRCGGRGRQRETACPACGGMQVEMRTERVVFNAPLGCGEGTRIRVAGKGHAGPNGGDAGDLLIAVHLEPHPVFRRDGDDLHVIVPVGIHEAALGAKVDVPGLDRAFTLRVPPGAQSGQRFRLRERGLPSARDGRRGDLIVEIALTLPSVLDERSKELLREFGRINSLGARPARREPSDQP